MDSQNQDDNLKEPIGVIDHLKLDELQKEFRLDEEERKGLLYLVKTSGKPMTMQEARLAIVQMVPMGLLRDMADFHDGQG